METFSFTFHVARTTYTIHISTLMPITSQI